jgi:hypothetical protein
MIISFKRFTTGGLIQLPLEWYVPIRAMARGHTFTDLGDGYYQFNLNTKPYPAGPGSEPIFITIDVVATEDREVQLEMFMALR